MPEPKGKLTPAQHQIMQAVWDAGPRGATVADIWRRIAQDRPIARTTVLNQVDRLEKRHWLRRGRAKGAIHYRAAMDRQAVGSRLAGEFVDEFFDGSMSGMLLCLADEREIAEADLERLGRLLDDAARRRRAKGGR